MEKPRIEEGLIIGGDYDSLYLLPILQAMADSAWDFPAAAISLGLNTPDFFGDEPTMYPTETEGRILANWAYTDESDREEFLEGFAKIHWDT